MCNNGARRIHNDEVGLAIFGFLHSTTSVQPALVLTPVGSYMSHWWRQEGHPAKIVAVRQ